MKKHIQKCRPVILLAGSCVALCLNMVFLYESWAQESLPQEPRKIARPPLVVLKQAEVQGRVFFLNEEGDTDIPAARLSVKVEDPAHDLLIFSSKTDSQGKFVLPNLDAGVYRLTLGRFSLELLIVQLDEDAQKLKPVPKTLLVLMPEALKD